MTIRTDILANVAGTGSPDITGGELSRARFNLNGAGTIAPRDTFNISSFVDNGVGDYTANFSIAFPNSDYSALGGAGSPGVQSGLAVMPNVSSANQAAASIRFSTVSTSGFSAYDHTHIETAFVGDKP